jgi:hypothetical protein
MGRIRRQENTTTQKTRTSIEDLVENEGNEYMLAELSRMMIGIFNKLNAVCKNCSKRI